MTFLLGEDKALREKLSGMTVSDQKADGQEVERPVKVWFGQPDQELTPQLYPYITIDMLDIIRDTQREMRGEAKPDYMVNPNLGENQDWLVEMPIPVYIDYQITSYARHPRHDRQILAQLTGVKLPIRFGILQVLENTTTDGEIVTNTYTSRRLDVMSVAKRDVTEQAKRLFVNAITVRVSSEIPLETYRTLYKVLQVNIDNPPTTRGGWEGVGPAIITPPPVTP